MLTKVEEKIVLCHFCHKPIHIDHLSLIFSDSGKKIFCCDNICCLVEADQAMEKSHTRTRDYQLLSHPSDKLKVKTKNDR